MAGINTQPYNIHASSDVHNTKASFRQNVSLLTPKHQDCGSCSSLFLFALHQTQMLFTVNWEHFRNARWARAFTKGNHLKKTKCKQDELTASSNTHHSRSTALSHVKMQATHVSHFGQYTAGYKFKCVALYILYMSSVSSGP